MAYGPKKHHRRSIPLEGYDYAQGGAYFVTVCAQAHLCLFGEIIAGEMRLNDWGRIVADTWRDLADHYPYVLLDAFVVMPNHVHGIIVLTDPVGAGFKPAPTDSAADDWTPAGFVPTDAAGAGLKPAPTRKRHGLAEIVRAFKTFSARRINQRRGLRGAPLWQRNYYEHIIRNDVALNRIRQYIADNPRSWATDMENPQAPRPGAE